MCSEKQQQANQANAQRSTGPRSEAGKNVARENALKHGLTSTGVVLLDEDEALYKRRLEEYEERLEPVDVLERDLVAQMAVASVQMERARAKSLRKAAAARRREEARW